jgi:small-conductance mechanosensitive channel
LLLNRASAERDDGGMPPWIRLSGWLAASTIVVALASGYIRFASLVAERVVTAAIVLLALILLLALIDALFGEGLQQDSPRRRRSRQRSAFRSRRSISSPPCSPEFCALFLSSPPFLSSSAR